MELGEALGLLQLQGEAAPPLTAESLRRQYLKLALRTHPDKNPRDAGAADRFARLGAAYALVLETVHHDAVLLHEQRRTSALLDLLLRALQGEQVDAELRALGEYRPPASFGVDLAVAFDARVPPPPQSTDEHSHYGSSSERPDLRQAFREAFQEEGLTEEGDPVGGYAFRPGEERCC